MPDVRRLEALAGSCYDAAIGQVSWESVLGGIASTFHGSHATLLQQRPGRTDARVIASHGFDAGVIASYEAHFKNLNLLLQAMNSPVRAHLWRTGVVRTSDMLCPDDVFLQSEYYNDFLRPISVRRLLSTTLSERDAIQLSVFQEKTDVSARRRHSRAMAYLAPHLRRALQLHEQLQAASAYRSLLEDYLAGISRGAAVLDAAGSVIYSNEAFRAMAAANDGLSVVSSRLSAHSPAVARRLNAAIVDAIGGGAGATLPIPRPSGAAPYHALISQIGSAGRISPTRRTILVIVSDPLVAATFDRQLLRETYGLTPTECDVACQLANGLSVEQMAPQMGIALGTLRTHLKRVLQKTQTHRQADLVRQLLLGRTLP